MTESYTIDRKTAAELLQVSVRTVDRYLKKGTLRHEKRYRKVYIFKDDLIAEMKKRELKIPLFVDPTIKNIAQGADNRINQVVESDLPEETYPETPRRIDNIQAPYTPPQPVQQTQYQEAVNYPESPSNIVKESSRLEDRIADSLDFYKNLYEVTKADLDDKNQQLTKLTFRLGQLEAQVNSSIPILEYKKQEKLLSETSARYQEALNKARLDANHSETLLRQQISDKEKDLIGYANKIKEIEHKLYLEEKNKHVFAILTFLALTALLIVWLALKH